MLDKLSKAILKYMIANGKNTSYVWSFSESIVYECQSTIYKIAEDINIDVEDIRACVRYLQEHGYIEYQVAVSRSGKQNVGFHLSHKGLNTFEISLIKTKEFMIKSILTPILVSIATTVIIHLLVPLL